jgi:glycosyltransferase involved in cell wall biosynthesis
VDHILVGSELAQRSYLKEGRSKEKPSLLKDTFSIDCERFSPVEDQPQNDGVFRVLHASHMNIIKGVGYLLDAWSRIQLERAELLLAGTMESELRRLYERLAPPSTQLLGYITETPALYRRVNLFISPSVADMHPYTVLEAMASGLPVIVSDRCGLSTLIENGVEGFVYPYDDTEALAAHIRWCYQETDSLKQMGIAARKKAMQCDRSHFSETVIAAMDQRIES